MFILLVRFHYSVCSLQLSSKITKNYIRKNVEIIEQSARCATRWRFFRKIFTTELENKIWTRSVSNIVWFSFWVWNQRNTDDGVTRNFSEIIYRDEQKKCFHSCFIDYERDFDNVLHDKFARVREILRNIELDNKDLNAIKNLYSNQKTKTQIKQAGVYNKFQS